MRLTLRTLLAYADDILDPADHEELTGKIEASDFATDLIHRTRDTVRRLRLGAPEVFAGAGDDVLESTGAADANAVAEYLDNTLSPESVADFERMCLEPGNEADMHLAEVTSCHHVLTMILGEPAEIDIDLRRRIYELPKKLAGGQQVRIEPAHLPPQEAPPQEALPQQIPMASSPEPPAEPVETEVPDYLRVAAAGRQRKKRWTIAAVFLALAAGIVGFFASGEFLEPEPPAEMAQSDLDSINFDPVIESIPSPDVDSAEEGEKLGADSSDEAPPFVPGIAATESEAASPAMEKDADLPPSAELPEATESQPSEIARAEDDEPTNLGSETAEVAPELPETEVEAPGEDPEMTASGEAGEAPLRVASADTRPDPEAPPKPSGPKQLGNYLGDNDVLLRYDASLDKWIRLSPRSAISTGDSLLALPKFRPYVVLAGVNTRLSGGTQLDLSSGGSAFAGEDLDLELAVIYGKVLLNAGLEGSHVGLHVGDEARSVRLAGSTSLAVEVQPVFVPGSDNEQQSSPVEVIWYLTSGSVEWPGPAGEQQAIEAPAMWKTVGGIDDLPQLIDQLPEWIDREPMTELQRRARDTMADELTPGEPVGLRLLELNDQREKGRRSEVRTLAAKSSMYVGEFEPFVKALSDKGQRRDWESQVKALRQALALSPQVAVRVREAFVNIRGAQAASDLMEMVAGYDEEAIGDSREALQEGALIKLIRWLENDSLDYRVLAIYNLNDITGTTSLKGFRPDASSQRRKIAVAKIRESLESNELLPKR